MNESTGKYLMAAGVLLVAAGIAVYFLHDKLHWFGRLPGDIRVERENFRFYFPITTMVLISIVLNIVILLIRKLLG